MLGTVEFSGPCEAPITFLMVGDIKAPTSPSLNKENWIAFQYVNKLIVKGGGTIDGQGAFAWSFNECNKNTNCPALPIVSIIFLVYFFLYIDS